MPPATSARFVGFPDTAELPIYLTPLLGREADVARVCSLFREARLVSLVGAGGSGKTRLAAAVGTAMRRRFAGGVAWIDLSALANSQAVAPHAASVLGASEQPGHTRVDALIDLLGSSAVLLILDNCEHLLDACAAFVDAVLRACPGTRVLTTSRQALGIIGEKAWVVPPLALPADDTGADAAPAVQLFVQRAGDVQPGFTLDESNTGAVLHVCRRLDGLPLAIELAAARVRMLPPAQLAARLDSMLTVLSTTSPQRLPRHRTLRALIDWSYDLLSADERRLLARLSVFAGGFTLDAAERVASGEAIPADHVLDLLAALVDRSLVVSREVQNEARFTLLETVRQYAAQKLAESGEADAVRARHALYFVDFAEAAEPHILGGARGMPWMARVERETGNLRAAVSWCDADPSRAVYALRIGSALLWYDFATGQFDEPRRMLQRSLERAPDAPGHVRARSLTTLGYTALWVGEVAGVLPPLTEAVELLRGTDRHTDLAFALVGLGIALGLGGDTDAAFRLFDEVERALGSPANIPRDEYPRALLYAFGRHWRGTVALAGGDLDLAQACYRAAVDVARAWGSHPTIAYPLAALARVLVLRNQLDDAHACLVESATSHLRHDERWGLVQALDAASLLFYRRGDPGAAARLLGLTNRLRRHSGIAPSPLELAQHAQIRDAAIAALGSDAFAAAYSEGEAMPAAAGVRMIATASAPAHEATHDVRSTKRRHAARGAAGDSAAEMNVGARETSGLRTPPHGAIHSESSSAGSSGAGPPDLDVRALGALEVRVRGEPLAGDAFGSSKPRELLLLLLCSPDGLTREQAGLAFWPDSSTVQVKNAFHVTLHRLRRTLGRHDWITITGDRYRIDPSVRVAFDVHAFRDGVESCLRERSTDAATLADALRLYRGDLLAGEVVGDWHLPLRDDLQRLYREGLRALGAHHMRAEQWSEAADAFRTLLKVEPLDEPACRSLMTCYARAGQPVEAMRLYENVARLMSEQLGSKPTSDTTALYHELQHPA